MGILGLNYTEGQPGPCLWSAKALQALHSGSVQKSSDYFYSKHRIPETMSLISDNEHQATMQKSAAR